jgi:hypothetical protein
MGVVAVDAFAFMILSLSVRVVVFLPINSLFKPLVLSLCDLGQTHCSVTRNLDKLNLLPKS